LIAIAALVGAVLGVIVALSVGITAIGIAVAQLLVSLYPLFRQDKRVRDGETNNRSKQRLAKGVPLE
jgi:hypothetical protein